MACKGESWINLSPPSLSLCVLSHYCRRNVRWEYFPENNPGFQRIRPNQERNPCYQYTNHFLQTTRQRATRVVLLQEHPPGCCLANNREERGFRKDVASLLCFVGRWLWACERKYWKQTASGAQFIRRRGRLLSTVSLCFVGTDFIHLAGFLLRHRSSFCP